MLDISLNLFPGVAVLKIWFGDLWGSLRFLRGSARLNSFSNNPKMLFAFSLSFSQEHGVEFSRGYKEYEFTIDGI